MDISKAVAGAIALIVIMIALFSLTTTIIDQEEEITADASTWNFTGSTGAESLLGLVPFVWIAAILLIVVVGAFTLAGLGGGHEV